MRTASHAPGLARAPTRKPIAPPIEAPKTSGNNVIEAIEGGTKCAATWPLQWGSKRGQIRLSRGKKDASKIFLQMAMEQGP